MKTLYRWFKKVVGVMAYLYWLPFFYGVKSGHVIPGMGEISSTILLFCIGILLSMGFLGMCKHDPVSKDTFWLKELYVDEIPNNLRVVTTWLGEIVVGVVLENPMQVALMTGLLFILMLRINWWIYNPVFMFWNIRFCRVRQVMNHEASFFTMPVQLEKTHGKEYLDVNENYKICRYNGKMDWIAFRVKR